MLLFLRLSSWRGGEGAKAAREGLGTDRRSNTPTPWSYVHIAVFVSFEGTVGFWFCAPLTDGVIGAPVRGEMKLVTGA